MEQPTPIENRAGIPAAQFDRFAQSLASHQSIKHALDWLQGYSPPLTLTDVVAQDEFSHDIVADYPGGLSLVYDVT